MFSSDGVWSRTRCSVVGTKWMVLVLHTPHLHLVMHWVDAHEWTGGAARGSIAWLQLSLVGLFPGDCS